MTYPPNLISSGEQATKFDGEKVRVELVPPELIWEAGIGFTYGANKYAPRNWEKGMQHSRLLGGLLRHVLADMGGERIDSESGNTHLSHAACCLAMLIASRARGIGEDDLPQT